MDLVGVLRRRSTYRHLAPPAVQWWWCEPSSWPVLPLTTAASASCRRQLTRRLCPWSGPTHPEGDQTGSPLGLQPQAQWAGTAGPYCPLVPRRYRRETDKILSIFFYFLIIIGPAPEHPSCSCDELISLGVNKVMFIFSQGSCFRFRSCLQSIF